LFSLCLVSNICSDVVLYVAVARPIIATFYLPFSRQTFCNKIYFGFIILCWITTSKNLLSPHAFYHLKMHKNTFAAGAPPRSHWGWGCLQRSPRSPSWIKGATSQREEGEKEGDERGKGRKGQEGWGIKEGEWRE